MIPTVPERDAVRAGVWESIDAPDGYKALAVYSTAGRRLVRIEIATDCYSHAWVNWLERWLRRWDSRFLRIVR